MTASKREALVANVLDLATQFEVWPEEYAMSPRDGKRHAADIRALVTEVERLTRERDEWVDRSLVLASESRVAVLTAEVERLREDAARLDYMDTQRNWTRWMGRDTGDGYTVWPVSGNDSFRAAIDAARTTGGRDA